MAIRLTEQQQHALDTTDAEPPQVVDPRTNAAYVLIPLTEYEAVREIVEDERQQRAIRGPHGSFRGSRGSLTAATQASAALPEGSADGAEA
jgi:hypothetical protein